MSESESLEVAYHGRKASRGGSERRRINILDAALRVVVREGVRAVRHRAVASEAKVPLSATTYYFKDITDLIVDTFVMFYERNTVLMKRNLTEALAAPLKEETKMPWQAVLSKALSTYLLAQVTERREQIIAEQAFFNEVLYYARLNPLAQQYQKVFCTKFLQLTKTLPVKNSELLAWTVYSLQRQLAYEALLFAEPVQAKWFEDKLNSVLVLFA